MQMFTGANIYRFETMEERNQWLVYYFPNRCPDDQDLYPGKFMCGPWVIKLFGDGTSVKIMTTEEGQV